MEADRFEIPACNIARLERELEHLQRKARRLGVPPLSFEVVERTLRDHHRLVHGPGECPGWSCKVTIEWSTIELAGETPKLAGWSFVGTLDHENAVDGAVMVRAVPGVELPPEYRLVSAGRCDHCGAHRRRRETFVVQHEDGTIKVVGRQCLSAFLGGADPKAIARWLEHLDALRRRLGSEDEDGFRGGRSEPMFEVEHALTVAASYCRRFGYLSRARAVETDGMSTREQVWSLLNPPWNMDAYQRREYEEALAKVLPEDAVAARRAIWWAGETVLAKPVLKRTNYEHNLIVALSRPVRDKTAGVAVSVMSAFYRAQERARTQEEKPPSQWVGAVGERLELVVRVERKIGLDNAWGTTLVKLADDAGNALAWFSSSSGWAEEGLRYRVKATVKGHDEYRGVKQTKVTRVTCLEAM